MGTFDSSKTLRQGILELIKTIGLPLAGLVFVMGFSRGYDLITLITTSVTVGLLTTILSFAALYACAALEKRSKWIATIIPFILIGLMLLAAFILLQTQSSGS